MKTVWLLTFVALAVVLAFTLSVAADEDSQTVTATRDWPQWAGPSRDAAASAGGVFHRPFELLELWRRPIEGGISALTVAAGGVYSIATTDGGDVAFALDAATGEEVWRVPLGEAMVSQEEFGATTTPASDGQRVFVLSPRCRLSALSAKDGSTIWSHDAVAEYERSLGSGCFTNPLLDGDRLIVFINGKPDRSVMAFDSATGDEVWSAAGVGLTLRRSSPALAVLAGVRQILVQNGAGERQGGVYGLRAEDGTMLWDVRFPESESFSNDMPIILDEHRLAQLAWNQMYLVEVRRGAEGLEGKLAWSLDSIRAGALPVNIHAVGHGEHLYGFGGDKLNCLRVDTGETVWGEKIYPGSLILVDEHLVVLSQASGFVRVIEATPLGYREKARAEVFVPGAESDTPPSFAGGTLYLRNSEEIVALKPVEVSSP